MKNKNGKLIIGILMILVILLLLFIFLRNRNSYKLEKVTDIKYYLLYEDKKYGVIDKAGNKIIEPIYNNIQIPNPSKDVFVCIEGYDTNSKQYNTKVINEKNEEILEQFNNPLAIQTDVTADGIPYEKSILKYTEDQKWGIASLNGRKITNAIYEEISGINYKEGLLLVKKDGKFGVINMLGKVVIKPEYDQITIDSYSNKETKYKYTGFIVMKNIDGDYKYGYINSNGKKLLKPEYKKIRRINEIEDGKNVYLIASKGDKEGVIKNGKTLLKFNYNNITFNKRNKMFIIQENYKYGVADLKGKTIVIPQYDIVTFGGIYINAVSGDDTKILMPNGKEAKDQKIYGKYPTDDKKYSIIIDRNRTYKVINQKDEVILDNNFAYIEYAKDGYFIVAKDSKYGIVNLEGKSVADLKYSNISKKEGRDAIIAKIDSLKNISIINSDMKITCSLNNAGVTEKDNYIVVYNENERRYFDYNGNEIQYKDLYPNNALYAKKVNGQWGFVDKDGNIKVQTQYELVTEFNEKGFAGIKKNGLWGVINSNGEVIQEPIYEIKWNSPEFLGKYYKMGSWSSQQIYTSQSK